MCYNKHAHLPGEVRSLSSLYRLPSNYSISFAASYNHTVCPELQMDRESSVPYSLMTLYNLDLKTRKNRRDGGSILLHTVCWICQHPMPFLTSLSIADRKESKATRLLRFVMYQSVLHTFSDSHISLLKCHIGLREGISYVLFYLRHYPMVFFMRAPASSLKWILLISAFPNPAVLSQVHCAPLSALTPLS